MYCENCQLEIKDQGETRCPLCGNQLRESSAAETMAGNAAGIDFDAMPDDAGAFVLDDEDSGGMDIERQTSQEMYPRGTGREMHASGAAAHAQTARQPALIDDTSTDMLDQVLEEYDPMVDEHFTVKKAGSKSRTTVLLILLLVCVLGAGGYYYFMMAEPTPPEPATPVKVVQPKKQDAVLDQVLKKEPVPAESGQPGAADNAIHADKKPEPAKPAQIAEKKIEEPVIAEPQATEAKPAEPAAASRTPDKVLHKDKKQPAVAMEKTEELPSAQHGAEAPAPVMAQDASREAGKAAGVEQTKKPAAPQTAPAEKPAAVGAGQPVFTVLTGSFRSQGNADAEATRFRKLGFDARTVTVELKGKGQWHRVLIGSWASRTEARQMAEEVRRKTGKKDASVITME